VHRYPGHRIDEELIVMSFVSGITAFARYQVFDALVLFNSDGMAAVEHGRLFVRKLHNVNALIVDRTYSVEGEELFCSSTRRLSLHSRASAIFVSSNSP